MLLWTIWLLFYQLCTGGCTVGLGRCSCRLAITRFTDGRLCSIGSVGMLLGCRLGTEGLCIIRLARSSCPSISWITLVACLGLGFGSWIGTNGWWILICLSIILLILRSGNAGLCIFLPLESRTVMSIPLFHIQIGCFFRLVAGHTSSCSGKCEVGISRTGSCSTLLSRIVSSRRRLCTWSTLPAWSDLW